MSKEILIKEELEKRDKIINTFDKNYLLEAGAGAGKTSIIVQRIINQIINSDIDPANIVAITFTKAASSELAERIQKKALELLKDESDINRINRLKAVDKIFTGTIHSFCDVILREMPFDADLTPGYEIVEDDEDFHNNIWYRFLRDKEDDYKELAIQLSRFNIDYLKLRTKAITAMSNPDIRFCGYEDCGIEFEDLAEEFNKLINDYGFLDAELFKNSSNLQKLFRSMLVDKKDLESYFKLGLFKEFAKKPAKGEDLYYDCIYKKHLENENKDIYIRFLDRLSSIYIKSNKLAYNKAVEFINMVVDYKNKNYKGKLTFNDLLYKALKLIKESSLAREHFKNKYKVFYIDEFQDTDPMQAELMLLLTDLNPGSLFIVGDPKQSIYRFRRADISIYNEVKELISKNGEVVHLDINFRSSDDICDFVYSTFKKKEDDNFGFGEDASNVQAGFKRILSLWDDRDEKNGEKQLRGVFKYTSPEKDDWQYVANMVKDILDNYYIAEKKNKDDEYYTEIRKVKYSDILILTKANLETGFYLKAFKDMGIPALLSGEKTLGDTREVMNLFILLDAIMDYRDDIKLVSLLRNSFYLDFDSIDLFMEEDRNLYSYLFNLKKAEDIEHPGIRKAFMSMNRIISLSRELNPITFLEKIIEERVGIFDLNKNYNDIELRDAQSALRQTVEILKAERCSSLYEVREIMKKLIEEKVQYELPVTEDETKHALRIMNIHKAKGLEANIVLLVGADKKRGGNNISHYVEEKNIGYMVFSSDMGILGPDEEECKLREDEFYQAEIDRLLYVAATRAKTCLIVADCTDSKGFLYPVSQCIEKEFSTENDFTGDLKSLEKSIEKEAELKYNFEKRLRREIFSPNYMKTSPSQFKSENKLPLNIKKGMKFKEIKVLAQEYDKNLIMHPRGNIFGSMVHRALELLIIRSNNLQNTNNSIIDYVSRFSIKEGLNKLDINKNNLGLFYPYNSSKVEELLKIKEEKGNSEVIQILMEHLYRYIFKILNNFKENPEIVDIFNNAKRVLTETPFTIALKDNFNKFHRIKPLINPDESNIPILVNGTIDLIIESKNGNFTIIDYKSDVILKGDLISRLIKLYTPQLIGYKVLLEKILKTEKVENLMIYSTFIDKLIKINGYLN